jgi:hypothetical protein
MNTIKCSVCGKFISYSVILKEVIVEDIPDTPFTIEETKFTHKKCL